MSTDVYAAISNVQAELSVTGVEKARKNTAQGYSFRSIDDFYNALAPLLAKYKLCILPRMVGRTHEERQTAKGAVLFYVTVDAEFDFVSATDGSKHTIKTFGEAMDSADKATNKAMSAAWKYAVMQAFCIPTEGDSDADASHPDAGRRSHMSQPTGAAPSKARGSPSTPAPASSSPEQNRAAAEHAHPQGSGSEPITITGEEQDHIVGLLEQLANLRGMDAAKGLAASIRKELGIRLMADIPESSYQSVVGTITRAIAAAQANGQAAAPAAR